MNIIVGCLLVVAIVIACGVIWFLEKLYPLDDETEQNWIDRQW